MKGAGAAWYVTLLVLVTGCGKEPVACDPCFTTAVAHVFVRDSLDRPVGGVGINVRAFLQICGLDFRGGEGGWVTEPDGHRRLVLSSLYSPFTANCFMVTVTNSSGVLAEAEFAASVRFEYPQPRDSVRFEIVIGGSDP